MKLYDLELSGHSHRVRLFTNLLGLDTQIIPVDLLNGAHKHPVFLDKNPFGQIPVLEDGDVTIHDSNAILVYLASKYDSARTWLPTNAEQAAQVQVWLSKAANELANGPAAARLVTVFGADRDINMAHAKAMGLFAVMNAHLTTNTWFVGSNPTIADVALYSYTAHAPEGGIDLSPFPNIQRWLKAVEALDGFVPMPQTDTDAKSALAA